MKGVSLSQLVISVADELRLVAANRRVGEEVMAFSECELELKANVETEANGGIKFNIINLAAKVKDTSSHSIKLKFKALSDGVVIAAVVEEEDSRQPVKKTS